MGLMVGPHYYDVVASNGGTIDLSSVGSIVGADRRGMHDWLRFRLESGGDIALTNLTQVTGRTFFSVDVDGYSLPALETAANTYFSIAAGRSASAPELLAMSGTGSGVNVYDGATFAAPNLVSVSDAALSIGAGGVLDVPNLVSLTNSTFTRRPDQTFHHGAITNVNGSELAVVDGAALDLSSVSSYTNTVNDYRANLTLLSADGAGSRLDLSGAQTFVSASWGLVRTLLLRRGGQQRRHDRPIRRRIDHRRGPTRPKATTGSASAWTPAAVSICRASAR